MLKIGDKRLKKKIFSLIFCIVLLVTCSVAMVFYALAATQANLKSTIQVGYTAASNVVCEASATYQLEQDASPTAFTSGGQNFAYIDSQTTKTLTASNTALVLNDMTSSYVIFTFTFKNKNLMTTYNIDIKLTDNSVCSHMTRKYYFGSLSSSNLADLASKIKSNGVDYSALSSQSLTLGYQETGKIYMLVEIISGIKGSYTANTANGFKFTLTSTTGGGVAFLSRDWKERLNIGIENIGDNNVTTLIFTKDSAQTSGLSNSKSVGTNSATSTSAYTTAPGISDVTAYWNSDKSKIVIYSPNTIYAPQSCYQLFVFCKKLTTIDLSNFNTSIVTDMSGMFYSCKSLINLDLSNFNTSNVTNMMGMFIRCSGLTRLNLSNFDTSNVTDMNDMFNSCSSLVELNLGNFNTSNVTDMGIMFGGCSGLTSLNLGNFNMQACTNFNYMFDDCSALNSITLPYNLQSGQTIELPASNFYNGSAGPYSTIGTATSGTTVACSTASSKVTLTKR